MPKELAIAIAIEDDSLAKSISKLVEDLNDVQVDRWYGAMEEKGPKSVKTAPDIIIVDDTPESRRIFDRLSHLRQNFPHASIFVVSKDPRPEHIVDVMKAGGSEFLVAPVSEKTMDEAVMEVRNKLTSSGALAKGKTYSFISSKGGLGATVIGVNAAAALAERKNDSVSLLDFSLQSGDASVLLDLVPKTTIYDICKDFHRLDTSFLKGAMAKHDSKIHFLAAPINPEDAEEVHADHVNKVLGLASSIFDYVLVDCTSMYVNDVTTEVFRSSRKIFVVTDMSVPAVRNAARLIQLIKKLGIDAGRIEVVVNRYYKGATLSIDEVERTLRQRIYWLFPNDFVDIVSSINRGQPLVLHKSSAPFAKNMTEFADRLRDPDVEEEYRGIRSAFGRPL